jgi:hypothetical protein
VEYEEQGVFNCEAGDKFVRVRVERVGDVALTTISGHKESLDVIEGFCQRTGAEYVVE